MMKFTVKTLIAVFVMSVAMTSMSSAADRVALVIGNAKYLHFDNLKSSVDDAKDVAATLKALDFDVILGINANELQFTKLVRQFLRQASKAKVAIFYYAGKNLLFEGKNYLVSVDAKLSTSADLEFETLSLRSLKSFLGKKTPTRLYFLDVGRASYFSAARDSTVRRLTGTDEEDLISGSFMAFATAPGREIVYGAEKSRNSPFSNALIKHLATPGLDVESLLRRVRVDVLKETNAKQAVWSNSTLSEPFYLNPK